MICAQAVDGFLQVVNLASGETCQYITLVEFSDVSGSEPLLTIDTVFELVGAAAALYVLVFVINTVLRLMGFSRG